MHLSKTVLKRAAALLLPMLLLSGCFVVMHDDYYDPYQPNTLIIKNDDFAYGSIWYAYVSPSSSPYWGDDLLGENTLYPGDELQLEVYECDRYYDILVEYDHGLVLEQDSVWLPCYTTTIVPFTDN